MIRYINTFIQASKHAEDNCRREVQTGQHHSGRQFRKGLRGSPLRHQRDASPLSPLPEPTSHRHHRQLNQNYDPTQPRTHRQTLLGRRGRIVHLHGHGALRWGSPKVYRKRSAGLEHRLGLSMSAAGGVR